MCLQGMIAALARCVRIGNLWQNSGFAECDVDEGCRDVVVIAAAVESNALQTSDSRFLP